MGQRERRRARGEARDEQIRAALEPLEPGERPLQLKIAVVIVVLLGAANLTLWLAGWELDDRESSGGGAIAFAAVMFVCAAGMWRKRYWAVLGFQALMALSAVVAALSLLVASNVEAVLRSLAIIAICAAMFWSMVRVMARIQMPQRGDSVRRHG